ncbi:MAG: hypothetical protein LBO79_02620 [Zoogloeaceae bacterium]|jgi:type III secretion system needle length determinant|nr:hypothetical protein [Zoogloeaceae bacterium]
MTSSIKTDRQDTSRQSGLSSLSPDKAAPVEETQVRRFEQIYRQEGGDSRQEGEYSRQEGSGSSLEGSNSLRKEGDSRPEEKKWSRPPDEKPADSSLSSLMSSLMSERLGMPAPPPPTAPVAAARPAAASEGETLEKLVRQILVARPEETGHSEVRLRVQDGLLPDTEIRLTRGADGLLSVTLSTGRDDAFQTLVGAQSALKDLLNAREKQEVRLTVIDTRDAQGDGDAGGRRSRGLMENAPDEDAR